MPSSTFVGPQGLPLPRQSRALLILISSWAKSKRGFLLWINATLICPLPHTWRRSGVKDGACSVRGREISHTPWAPEWGLLLRDFVSLPASRCFGPPPFLSNPDWRLPAVKIKQPPLCPWSSLSGSWCFCSVPTWGGAAPKELVEQWPPPSGGEKCQCSQVTQSNSQLSESYMSWHHFLQTEGGTRLWTLGTRISSIATAAESERSSCQCGGQQGCG